ncbi:MAG: hypothetical protein LBK63_00900 [Treponema sp.]|jgi:hypothetical protein|nr:hypothetical protein [Treponema sp.]
MKKKFLCGIVILLVTGGALFAQMPFPMQDPVKIGMGEMSLGGMMLTGFSAEMNKQAGNAEDGVWKAGLINPVNVENRVDLYLNYKILDYGIFVNLRSQGWGQNSFGAVEAANFNAYANFFDNKVKITAGKLNDWLWSLPDTHLWQTWYYGEMWYFTNRGPGAVRLEVKPIDGLDFGFQFPFVNQEFSQGDFKNGDADDTEAYNAAMKEARKDAWREFGFAVQYSKDKINAVAGLQLDSKMDKMSRDDFRTYLDDYYGSAVTLLWDYAGGPKFKERPPVNYDDGLFAFAGTRLNVIDNFEIDFQMAFMGLGDFNKYGYSRINEHVSYSVPVVSGLSLSLNGEQQFYGKDVFKDEIINSPLLTFSGGVSYVLPFMKNVTAVLEGSRGFCKDVLDSQWEIIPKISIQINKIVPVATVEIFYKANQTDYKDAIESDAAKPKTYHSVNFAVSVYL